MQEFLQAELNYCSLYKISIPLLHRMVLFGLTISNKNLLKTTVYIKDLIHI